MGTISISSFDSLNNQIPSQNSSERLSGRDLNIKTEEEDLVFVSLSKEFNYSKSQTMGQFEGEKLDQIFSIASAAASQYSLKVRDNLNEEEFSVIKKIAESLFFVAERFFSKSNSNPEQEVSLIAKFLGAFADIELNLEKNETALSDRELSTNKKLQDFDYLLKVINDDFPVELAPKIRDLSDLLTSVLDSFLNDTEKEYTESNLVNNFKGLLVNKINEEILTK